MRPISIPRPLPWLVVSLLGACEPAVGPTTTPINHNDINSLIADTAPKGGVIATTAVARAVQAPSMGGPAPSAPMVRTSCGGQAGLRGGSGTLGYGSASRGGASSSGAHGRAGAAGGGASATETSAAPASATKARPAPKPAASAPGVSSGPVAAGATAPATPPPAAEVAEKDVAGAAPNPSAQEALAAAPDAAPAAPAAGMEERAGDTPSPQHARDEAPARTNEYAKPVDTTPQLDWGATVFLSNDDSMSLASAQRLLWAVEHDAPFTSAQVRPHELLNYFTFDGAAHAPGETFSVLGTAEQRGDDVTIALAVRGQTPARPPLDLSLVVDRSGSMRADGRMDYVKRGVLLALDQLAPGDRVDLVLFDSEVCTAVRDFVVGRDNLEDLKNDVRSIQPRSATDLAGGLRAAYALHASRMAEQGRSRRVVLLTDAFLNEGNLDPNLIASAAEAYDRAGVRVTAVGVGREFNDAVLDTLTERSHGSYVYLGSEAVVDRVFGTGFSALVQTIAEDVQFSLELPPSLAMTRFYGEESSTVAADVQPVHFSAGNTQLFLQDLKSSGDVTAPLTFVARYTDPVTGARREERFTAPLSSLLNADRHNLRKAQALMRWSDLLLAWSVADRSCAQAAAFHQAVANAPGDAELAYVQRLTTDLCGAPASLPTPKPSRISYRVRINSDQPIAELSLRCGGETLRSRLSGSDTVARFDVSTPGTCELTLQGQMPLLTQVQVPAVGGQSTCMLRGGRLSCS